MGVSDLEIRKLNITVDSSGTPSVQRASDNIKTLIKTVEFEYAHMTLKYTGVCSEIGNRALLAPASVMESGGGAPSISRYTRNPEPRKPSVTSEVFSFIKLPAAHLFSKNNLPSYF